jgi:hypothetical protein
MIIRRCLKSKQERKKGGWHSGTPLEKHWDRWDNAVRTMEQLAAIVDGEEVYKA